MRIGLESQRGLESGVWILKLLYIETVQLFTRVETEQYLHLLYILDTEAWIMAPYQNEFFFSMVTRREAQGMADTAFTFRCHVTCGYLRPEGMVASAIEFGEVCRKHDFHNFIFSTLAFRKGRFRHYYRAAYVFDLETEKAKVGEETSFWSRTQNLEITIQATVSKPVRVFFASSAPCWGFYKRP